MFYIVGINHSVQFKKDEFSLNFLSFIRDIIINYNIEFIAEEWSEDADRLWKVKESNLSSLSKELNKPLIQFEPNEIDKNKFGIMTQMDVQKTVELYIPTLKTIEDIKKRESEREKLKKKNYKAREKYWLEKIKPYLNRNTLVVCGNDHIDTFCELLLKHNFNYSVLSKDFWILN